MLDTTAHPPSVNRDAWQAARTALLATEKAATRLADATAAQRRHLPMTEVENYTFQGVGGPITFTDLFEGRSQLIVHNFMFHPDWTDGCPSCTNLAQNGTPHLADLAPYDVTFIRLSRAPIDKLMAYSRKMGWDAPWYSTGATTYGRDWSWTTDDDSEVPGLSVYVQREGTPFLTYSTSGRGVENVSTLTGYVDLLPYGRLEAWQQVPEGWPQIKQPG